MRQVDSWGGDNVYYVLVDHLGTTSVVLDGDGDKVAESRHWPYGAVRWSWSADGSGTLPTDYRFTGQRDVGYINLVQMGVRWYDPGLGRWTSPETLVPEPANPQSFNRLTYGYNPVKFRDPTGHFSEDQLRDWYGEDWKSLFDDAWITLLLEAEFGDMGQRWSRTSPAFTAT